MRQGDRIRSFFVDSRGGAVVLALMIVALLALLGAGLLTLADAEVAIASGYRHAQEASHGAEAAAERAMSDLQGLPDWSVVLAAPPGNTVSSFNDGRSSVSVPGARVSSLSALTAELQRESDARIGPAVYGADAPQWRLFAHATLQDLLPASASSPPLYLVVWVADDGSDGDGDPERDANGRVMLRAVAFGTSGARRSVEVSVARTGNGVLKLTGWHRGG
jgi:hypothetical protein